MKNLTNIVCMLQRQIRGGEAVPGPADRAAVRSQVPAQTPSLQGHQEGDPARGGGAGGLQGVLQDSEAARGLRVQPRDDTAAGIVSMKERIVGVLNSSADFLESKIRKDPLLNRKSLSPN